MGMASRMSRPLPCGTPSMMSIRTTSASSFDAIQCAAVAPTFPDPTMLTFFRMKCPLQKITIFNRRDRRVRRERIAKTRRLLLSAFSAYSAVNSSRCRQHSCAHVFDDRVSKPAGADLGRTLHQALKIVCDFLLLYGALDAAL